MHALLPEVPGYSVNSIIGYGGTATVYLATQHALQRNVALKILNRSAAAAQDYCERFLREAQATALVSDHPHIVTVHDFAQLDTVYYIAMQYLPGENLKQKIDSQVPINDPLKIIEQLATALAYVHGKGFIHRDIKPANVLFSESGEAMLSDFGVAKTLSRHTQLTHHGSVIGTAKYMSPEQCRGKPEIDLRSDLYSLGVVFYEMLSSHPPYESIDPMALMLKHISDPVPSLPTRYANYQPVLDKLMAKQPEQRYNSANELLTALDAYSNQTIKDVRKDATGNNAGSSRENVKPSGASSPRLLSSTATVVALLAGLVAFMYSTSNSSMPDQFLRCPSPTSEETARRDTFIELAMAHQAIGRLDHPVGANALEAYLLALKIDPCNDDIKNRVEHIRRNVSQTP